MRHSIDTRNQCRGTGDSAPPTLAPARQQHGLVSALLITALLLSACATQRFTLQTGAAAPTRQGSSDFFVYGIAQTDHINVAEACGGADKVAAIETQESVVNLLLELLTWGLYTPRDYKVYCTQ